MHARVYSLFTCSSSISSPSPITRSLEDSASASSPRTSTRFWPLIARGTRVSHRSTVSA